MSAASTSIPITASVVEIIEEYANNDLPTWNLTVKRRQKMVITVFAFLAYIKMIEGKRDDMEGQEEFMQVTVGSLVADWVENKGLLNIQSKEVDLLLPHFEKMMVKTTAGKVCFANYSKYTEKKQVKYTGKTLNQTLAQSNVLCRWPICSQIQVVISNILECCTKVGITT